MINDKSNNKTAIITGASKGIGSEIALKFAKAGYNVVVNYRNAVPDALTEKLNETGSGFLLFKADVSTFEDAKLLVEAAYNKFSSIDVLVNNAGITKDCLIMRMSQEDFDSVININLKGTFNMIRHVSNYMLRQRSGAIINIASVVGVIGNVGQSNYAASKAGIIGLTKSVAKELAMRGITCNAIAPGFIETDMTNVLSDKLKNQLNDAIPLKRFGTPLEVAELVAFIAENKYITGQVINIDGGMVM